MKKIYAFLFIILTCGSLHGQSTVHDLTFDKLASRWDEAIPLGNGVLGTLIWQKSDRLRFSLDRADLWDLRPMKGLHRKEFSYQWVIDHVKQNDYSPVQKYFDEPYDNEPAPSKIPGGALEFNTENWGSVQSVKLLLQNASCVVKWKGGTQLETFINATKPVGWFKFKHLHTMLVPMLIAPKYQGKVTKAGDPVGGDDLARLGYSQGTIIRKGNSITYRQTGWGGFTYQINVRWKYINSETVEGSWSISSQLPGKKINPTATTLVALTIKRGYSKDQTGHAAWWNQFWNKSAIHLPDTILEKQ